MKDYWGVGKATKPMLPLIAIPTTAGTGSECQSAALIADEETHQKMACLDPKAAAAIAILDPLLTVSQPPRVTACTGIDALAHALETAVTRKRTPISALFSREAFRLCFASFCARAGGSGRRGGARAHAARRGLRRLRNREFHARRGALRGQSAHRASRHRAWPGGRDDAAGHHPFQCRAARGARGVRRSRGRGRPRFHRGADRAAPGNPRARGIARPLRV